MGNVYVKLLPHSEYVGFSIFDDVFESMENAIQSAIEDAFGENKDNVAKVLISERRGSNTFVMVLGSYLDEDEIAEIENNFKKEPENTCYSGHNAVCNFCIRMTNVK
jgi:hypothetical protein